MRIILTIAIAFFASLFVPPPVGAQMCSGGTMTFAQKVESCKHVATGAFCNPYIEGTDQCLCTLSCPTLLIKEICADYTDAEFCTSVGSIDRSVFACGSGKCVWNGPAGGGGIPPPPPPPPGGIPPPPPSCPATCGGGILCDNTPVTGINGQHVCGRGGLEYKCECGSWASTGNSCTDGCPVVPPPQPPPARCDNAVKEFGEECDLGLQNGACPSLCSLTCTVNTCNPVSSAPIACNQIAPSQRWETQELCVQTGIGTCFGTEESKNFAVPLKTEFIKLVATAVPAGIMQKEECSKITVGTQSATLCTSYPKLAPNSRELSIPINSAILAVNVNHLLDGDFPGGALTTGSMTVRTDALFCGKESDIYDPPLPPQFESVTIRIRINVPSLAGLPGGEEILSRVSIIHQSKSYIDRAIHFKHSGTGVFEGEFVSRVRLGSGSTIYVKIPKHLRIQKDAITMVSGITDIDLSNIPILAGDVAEPFGIIDSYDMSLIRLHAGSNDVKSLVVADINNDGTVDQADLQLVAQSLNYEFNNDEAFQGSKGNQQGTLEDTF